MKGQKGAHQAQKRIYIQLGRISPCGSHFPAILNQQMLCVPAHMQGKGKQVGCPLLFTPTDLRSWETKFHGMEWDGLSGLTTCMLLTVISAVASLKARPQTHLDPCSVPR
jgi:hypothetical protein